MPVTSRVSAGVSAELSTSNALLALAGTLQKQYAIDLPNGTTAGKANRVYAATLTIALSSFQDLDLASALVDVLGAALPATGFAKVKAILARAAAGNTNNVIIGGAPANAFVGPFADATDKVSLAPGDILCVTNKSAGWTVTPATGDLLRIANSGAGTGVDVDIVIIGTDA